MSFTRGVFLFCDGTELDFVFVIPKSARLVRDVVVEVAAVLEKLYVVQEVNYEQENRKWCEKQYRGVCRVRRRTGKRRGLALLQKRYYRVPYEFPIITREVRWGFRLFPSSVDSGTTQQARLVKDADMTFDALLNIDFSELHSGPVSAHNTPQKFQQIILIPLHCNTKFV